MTDRSIGRYDVVRILGEGAMGVVYEALDPRLARKVAIKTIRHDDLSATLVESYERRFLTEARSVARLNHPHIVRVFDAGQSGEDTYLVMEYVQGVNLKHCLRRGVRFSPAGTVRILVDMLEALSHAHAQKIIHRDIKPENILMDATGTVKLTDFGIAKILDDEVDNGTQLAGKSIGTPRYMSPEQVRGLPTDERSDVFSAGVLMYELLTAAQPFDGSHHMAIATQILHDDPAPPSARQADIPVVLDAIVQRALAKRPEDRYPNAQAFRADLVRAVAAEPATLALGAVDAATCLVRPDTADTLRGLLDRSAGAGLSAAQVPSPELAPVPGGADPSVGASTPRQTTPVHPVSTTDPADYPPPEDGTVFHPSILPPPVASPAPSGTDATGANLAGTWPAEPLARRRRWPWVLGALLLLGLALLWRPFPSKQAPATSLAVTDPAQSLSPKEELVPPSPAAPTPGAAPPVATSATPSAPTADVGTVVTPVPAGPATPKPPESGERRKDATAPVVPVVPSAGVAPAPVPEGAKPKPRPEPVAASAPAAVAPPEPCPDPTQTFLERESCLWKACFTDAFRAHPVCKRFHPETK